MARAGICGSSTSSRLPAIAADLSHKEQQKKRKKKKVSDLDSLISAQRSEIKARQKIFSCDLPSRKKEKSGLCLAAERAGVSLSRREKWSDQLSILEDGFFTSKQALMKDTARVARGTSPCTGLFLTAENNSDIERVYEQRWQTKEALGQSLVGFDQLKSTVGQYARMCIA